MCFARSVEVLGLSHSGLTRELGCHLACGFPRDSSLNSAHLAAAAACRPFSCSLGVSLLPMLLVALVIDWKIPVAVLALGVLEPRRLDLDWLLVELCNDLLLSLIHI